MEVDIKGVACRQHNFKIATLNRRGGGGILPKKTKGRKNKKKNENDHGANSGSHSV